MDKLIYVPVGCSNYYMVGCKLLFIGSSMCTWVSFDNSLDLSNLILKLHKSNIRRTHTPIIK